MQTYDVHHLELFDIKSKNGYVYHLGLLRAIQQRKTELKPWEVDHRLRL